MKNVILALLFVFGATQLTQAQIDFGIKGGVNYNSQSISDVQDDVLEYDAKSKTGFHAGVWTRFELPIVDFYIRPELVFTALKSEISSSGEVFADYDFQKIDIPILFGKRFLKVAHVYVGPSFQYLIDGDFSYKDLDNDFETEVDGLTVGVQFGAGIELGNIGLDVRWERGFSDKESTLIGDNTTQDVVFDTRVNQIIVGLSYKF